MVECEEHTHDHLRGIAAYLVPVDYRTWLPTNENVEQIWYHLRGIASYLVDYRTWLPTNENVEQTWYLCWWCQRTCWIAGICMSCLSCLSYPACTVACHCNIVCSAYCTHYSSVVFSEGRNCWIFLAIKLEGAFVRLLGSRVQYGRVGRHRASPPGILIFYGIVRPHPIFLIFYGYAHLPRALALFVTTDCIATKLMWRTSMNNKNNVAGRREESRKGGNYSLLK